MTSDPKDCSFRFFDFRDTKSVVESTLPHWSQTGTLCFITRRTVDSIPTPVLNRWHHERWQWLKSYDIDQNRPDWRVQLDKLDLELRREYRDRFSARWHELLDQGHGACVLRRPNLAKIVADSFHKFDGDRYILTDFVVMPNHVHLLCAFPNEEGLLKQCDSWKHYTAVQINRALNAKGRFWQEEGFDHLVRNADQFESLRRYIAENPMKCHLSPNEYVHFSKSKLS